MLSLRGLLPQARTRARRCGAYPARQAASGAVGRGRAPSGLCRPTHFASAEATVVKSRTVFLRDAAHVWISRGKTEGAMSWIELVGYCGSALAVWTYWMRDMVALRIVAVIGSLCFLTYGFLISSAP